MMSTRKTRKARRACAGLILSIVVAFAAAPVQAATSPLYRLGRALGVARQVWPGVCWPITIQTSPSADELGSDVIGLAWPSTCTIWIGLQLTPQKMFCDGVARRATVADGVTCGVMYPDPWWKVCAVVVHEVGHLDGQGHSTDQDSVMYPVIDHPVSVCPRKP